MGSEWRAARTFGLAPDGHRDGRRPGGAAVRRPGDEPRAARGAHVPVTKPRSVRGRPSTTRQRQSHAHNNRAVGVACRAVGERRGLALVAALDVARELPGLSKIPSKIAKFHLQIVENRLEFQSKILPCCHGSGSSPWSGTRGTSTEAPQKPSLQSRRPILHQVSA